MARLHQVIAVSNGHKSRAASAMAMIRGKLQNAGLMVGILRVYKPFKDGPGEQLPPEVQLVQFRGEDAINEAVAALTPLFNTVATVDETNCSARADVVVDGVCLIANAPVTTLLFLEKQITSFRDFVASIPTLDTARQWKFSDEANCFQSAPDITFKMAKIEKSEVIVPPTPHHPAQVSKHTEDVPLGEWTTIRSSGALPAADQREMLDRIDKVIDAVKTARTAANEVMVVDSKVAGQVFSFICPESAK